MKKTLILQEVLKNKDNKLLEKVEKVAKEGRDVHLFFREMETGVTHGKFIERGYKIGCEQILDLRTFDSEFGGFDEVIAIDNWGEQQAELAQVGLVKTKEEEDKAEEDKNPKGDGLESKSHKELQALCKAAKLPAGGSTEELIKRLNGISKVD